MFKKGELVTSASLTSFFKTIKLRLNEISSVQIGGISIGQVLGIGKITKEHEGINVCNVLMSSTSEQYFDSSHNIVYYVPEDSIVQGGESWLEYWLEEIRKLEEI
ncbi:hypothetical protein EOM86_06260 [Candidatus Nomurabacteria bacterium]|nr:hypothetical protein [Candidatus Nomurabacteria bacterium]